MICLSVSAVEATARRPRDRSAGLPRHSARYNFGSADRYSFLLLLLLYIVLISVAVSSGSAQEYRERRFSPIVATRVAPSFPLGPNFQVLGRTIDSGELPKLKASEKPQRRPSRGREAVEKKHEDDYGTGKEKSERKREEKAVQKERATEPDRTKAAVAEIGLVWGDTEGMNDVLHKKSRETVGRIDGENNGYEGSPKKVQENSTSSNPLMVRLPNWAYNSNNVPSKQPEKLELPEAENVKEIERDISKEKDHEEEEDLSEERMVGFEIAGEPGASALEGDLEASTFVISRFYSMLRLF